MLNTRRLVYTPTLSNVNQTKGEPPTTQNPPIFPGISVHARTHQCYRHNTRRIPNSKIEPLVVLRPLNLVQEQVHTLKHERTAYTPELDQATEVTRRGSLQHNICTKQKTLDPFRSSIVSPIPITITQYSLRPPPNRLNKIN